MDSSRSSAPAAAPAPGARFVLRRMSFADPVVEAMVRRLQDEFVGIYGGPDRTRLDAAMFEAPTGAFFVGFDADRPVAMGGWRHRPDLAALGGSWAAEIKRMFVVPPARRRGLARLVLARLEGSARSAGADVMVLESGTKQPAALALYTDVGYADIPGYGIYRDSPYNRCLAKRL